MRTEATALAAAAAIGAQLLWLGAPAGPAVAAFTFTAFTFLACAAMTLLAWIAARGRRPLALTAGVALFGTLTPDPLAAAAAALLTGATLHLLEGKPVCAASSRQ